MVANAGLIPAVRGVRFQKRTRRAYPWPKQKGMAEQMSPAPGYPRNKPRERTMKFFRTALLAASTLTFAAAASAQMEGSGHGNHGTGQTQPTTNPADPAVTGRTGAPATGTTGQGSTS